MINYETNTSSFFVTNKNHCETIENLLKNFKYEYSGFSNSYGYEIETTFKRNHLDFNLKYTKHQTTRDGVIIPIDASNYAGVNLIIKGFDKINSIEFGKNKIKRFFISKKFKEIVPSPFYITTNSSIENNYLFKILLDNKIDTFKLKNGEVKIKIHSASGDIFGLVTELEKTIT